MNSKDLLQLYNGQLQEFELAKKNYTDLQQAVYRDIPFDLFRLRIQYNPARMISTNARHYRTGNVFYAGSICRKRKKESVTTIVILFL